MRTEDVLKEIGLTGSEAKVYLALLELGDTTRSDIVNTSGITGSKVYEILNRLQNKGLVSIYIKDNVKHFKPTNPKQIKNYLEDKRKDLSEAEKQVESILPTLLAQYSSSREEQEVELFSGLKGIEIIFREQVELLHEGDICYVIGGTRGTEEGALTAFFQKIHLLREKKGIKTKMIYNSNQKDFTKKAYSSKAYPHTATRYIDHKSPVAINIYRNRTTIIIFGKSISAIHIKSQEVANSFLEQFNSLWRQSKN